MSDEPRQTPRSRDSRMISTVYLDTANWIDLAEGNCCSAEFEAAVSTGNLEPVLSPIHILELANPEQRNWKGVSNYIDRIRSMGVTHWALRPDAMARDEVGAAFVRFLKIEPPKLQPFRASLIETLDSNTSITDKLETESVQKEVNRVRNHRDHHGIYRSARNHVFPELRKNALRDPKKLILYYVPKSLPSSGLFVEEPTRREFAETLDIMTLPAFSMTRAYDQGMSQIERHQLSDYEDNLHLAGLAYCDVGFADRKTCAALKRGRARIVPMRNGLFSQWLTTLTEQ